MSTDKTSSKNSKKNKAPKAKSTAPKTKKVKDPAAKKAGAHKKTKKVAAEESVKAHSDHSHHGHAHHHHDDVVTEKQTRPLIILQVLPEMKSGGVERGTIEIAKGGKKLGHQMIVASAGGHLVNQLESADIRHIKLPLASKNPFVIMDNIHRLRKVIKEYNVDIVHARSRAPAWSAYFAAKKAKCHFVTTFHGAYSIGNIFKKYYNSVMTKGEKVIAISNFIRDHMLNDYKVDASRIRVVPRGVDLEQFSKDKVHKIRIINMAEQFKIELDVPVILLPGRFTRWKGQDFLIDALATIKDEKFVCIFAGYDKKHENYYRELERKVKEKDLFHKVRMIGEIKDMPSLYSLSDIVVSASLRPEAFGRITIEGQAMEKMVIATNHGGSCETVTHGETGWLVEPGDIEGLATVLKELLNINPKERKAVTSKARHNIEHNFSTEHMVKKTFAVYKEVMNGK